MPPTINRGFLCSEIAVVEGINLRWWLRKCERLFNWYKIPEGQRVALATSYFNNTGDAWFQRWSRVRGYCIWEEFAKKLCERIGKRIMMDVIRGI